MPASPTKRARIAILGLVCLLVAAGGFYLLRNRRARPGLAPSTLATPAPDILDELPSTAPGVAYVDVARLRKLQNSPLAAMLGLAGSDPAVDRDYREFVRGTGFDYTRDLDKAAMAFWLSGEPSFANGLRASRSLTIAEGRFDQAKIRAYALGNGGRPLGHGPESIYEVPGNPPVAFEFLSPTRIVLASGKDAASLLGPLASHSFDPAVEALVDRVSGAPVFAVARTDNLPPTFYDNFRSSPELGRMTRNVRGLTFAGEPKADALELSLDAECDSITHALEMSTLLDGLRLVGSMALADPKTRQQMTREQYDFAMALLSQAKISHENRWVRLRLDLGPSVLEQKTVISKP